jgi:tRNA pseudouridine55 synthase
VGPFSLADARTLEALEEGFDERVLLLDAAVAQSFPRRELTESEAVDLSYGKKLEPTGVPVTVGAFNGAGECVALLEDLDGRAKPTVVFRPA